MRSSKNCDLQFANGDRFKANYSVDIMIRVKCRGVVRERVQRKKAQGERLMIEETELKTERGG